MHSIITLILPLSLENHRWLLDIFIMTSLLNSDVKTWVQNFMVTPTHTYTHPPTHTTILFYALHCNALHGTLLPCTAIHPTALHCTWFTSPHCKPLHCESFHCTALWFASLLDTVFDFTALPLNCTALPLHCTTSPLHCTATSLHCHFTSLPLISLHCLYISLCHFTATARHITTLPIHFTDTSLPCNFTARHCHLSTLHFTVRHFIVKNCSSFHCNAPHTTVLNQTIGTCRVISIAPIKKGSFSDAVHIWTAVSCGRRPSCVSCMRDLGGNLRLWSDTTVTSQKVQARLV